MSFLINTPLAKPITSSLVEYINIPGWFEYDLLGGRPTFSRWWFQAASCFGYSVSKISELADTQINIVTYDGSGSLIKKYRKNQSL